MTASARGERVAFPGFLEQDNQQHFLWMPPDLVTDDIKRTVEGDNQGGMPECQLTGPVTYRGQTAIKREVDTLTTALRGLHPWWTAQRWPRVSSGVL